MPRKKAKPPTPGMIAVSVVAVALAAILIAGRFPSLRHGSGLVLLVYFGLVGTCLTAEVLSYSLRQRVWGWMFSLIQLVALVKVCSELWVLYARK